MRRYTAFDDHLPLTEDEREHLLHIYKKRLGVLGRAFSVLGILALLVSHPWALVREDFYPVTYNYSGRYGRGEVTWVEVWPITHNQFIYLLLAFWAVVLGTAALVAYRSNALPYLRDARAGFKAVLYHTVTGRQYFEHVGEYYLLLDNPECMNVEVDAETYHRVQPGDRWATAFGPRSGYAFNPLGRFSLM